MKTTITILTIFLLSLFAAKAQQGDRELDFRVGVGAIAFEKIDYANLIGELEIAAEFNNRVSLASSLVSSWNPRIGGDEYENRYEDKNPWFLQLNLNAIVSPFGNHRRNDFRIGAGPSYYFFLKAGSDYKGSNGLGFSLMAENTYKISGDTFLGIKVVRQHYVNGNVFWGVLLKAGIKI